MSVLEHGASDDLGFKCDILVEMPIYILCMLYINYLYLVEKHRWLISIETVLMQFKHI